MTRYILLLAVVLSALRTAGSQERVSIQVMGLFHTAQFTIEPVPGNPLLVSVGGFTRTIDSHSPQRVAVRNSNGKLTAVLAARSYAAASLAVQSQRAGDAEFVLAVPGRLRRRYRGRLTIQPLGRELTAVVTMDLENAVASVVAAEAQGDAPLEFLKAQAVAARSYLVAGGRRHTQAAFCDTTHCQFLRALPPVTSAAAQATRATVGLVLKWNGRTFPAMYSASCGGHTRSLQDVGYEVRDYPYFAVECPYCRRVPENWHRTLEAADAGTLGGTPDEESRLKVGRKLGWSAVPSNTYSKREVPGGAALAGRGRGHGVGLCQRGAAAMAKEGRDFRAILAHYYPNTAVESE